MKIITGISKSIIQKMHNETTEKFPSQYSFKINIDNKEYNACLYCLVIYAEEANRNIFNGKLEHIKRKTINRIEIYNLDDYYKENLYNQRKFRVDDEDYYLGKIEQNSQNDITTIIAINTNQF